ncbi:MAG: hypothetical protein IKK34_08095 [Clostridia bacterium]|nr:hypothetical protein [Clostridia bacterium]
MEVISDGRDYMIENDVRVTLDECWDESGFDYKGRAYYFSHFGPDAPYVIWGPYNERTELSSIDEVLDTLLIEKDMTFREALKKRLIP